MKILKVFNNNVVLADDPHHGHVVLTGRGLGFQAKPGGEVDPARVVQVFVPDAEHDIDQLRAFLTEIPRSTWCWLRRSWPWRRRNWRSRQARGW